MSRALTPEQIAEAKQVLHAGLRPQLIAERFGVDVDTIRRAVDPLWAAKRRAQINAVRQGEAAAHRVDTSDAAARLAEVPADNRSLTARIMGDPIPGDGRRGKAS